MLDIKISEYEMSKMTENELLEQRRRIAYRLHIKERLLDKQIDLSDEKVEMLKDEVDELYFYYNCTISELYYLYNVCN